MLAWLVGWSWVLPSSAKDTTARLEIKSYRFHRHGQEFERLVLEFTGAMKKPEIKISEAGEHASLITIEKAGLSGAIPEAAINDTFSTKASYLHAISIESETPSAGFSLKAEMKGEGSQLDAFWLNSPPRLVMDFFPQTSPRATNRHPAETAVARHKSQGKAAGKTRDGIGEVLCFPSNSQVAASVGYGKGNVPVSININGKAADDVSDDEGISCFPSSKRVRAVVSYHRVSEAPVNRPTTAPVQISTPSAKPSPAVTEIKPSPANALPTFTNAAPTIPAAIAEPTAPPMPKSDIPKPPGLPPLSLGGGDTAPARNTSSSPLPGLPPLGGSTPSSAGSPPSSGPTSGGLLPPLGSPPSGNAPASGSSLNSLLPPLN